MKKEIKKKQWIRRIFAWLLISAMALSSVQISVQAKAWDPQKEALKLRLRFWEDENPDIRFYINAAAKYILEDEKKQSEIAGIELPGVGSTYGEWSVWDLLRGMYTGLDYINSIPEEYFEGYLRRMEEYVTEKKGILDRSKSTEWSRVILPLTAMGYDIRNVAGYDFIEKLSESFTFSYVQGINGPIWEIISMNSGGYQFVETGDKEKANSFGKMLDYIAEYEITDANGKRGGWALSDGENNTADPDITGMALTALAPYYLDEAKYLETGALLSYEEFAAMVERGILKLSEMQQPNGGFSSWGTVNSESTVWAMIPLIELGIDPKSEQVDLPHLGQSCSFVTKGAVRDGVWSNNMVDALLTFWAAGSGSTASVGGFKHVTTGYDGGGGSGTVVNAMATDQALYGLIAYDRFRNHLPSLFDQSDQMDGSYRYAQADVYTVTYHGNGKGSDSTVKASPYGELVLPGSVGNLETGESLTGWNTKADGTGTTYFPGEVLCMPEHDIVLYAQYGEARYRLTLEMNGGTLAEGIHIPSEYAPYSEEIILPTAEQVNKEGCRFDGWYENEKFTGQRILSIPKGSYGDKTLYAKWVVISDKANQFYAIVNRLSSHAVTISDGADIRKARELYDSMSEAEKGRIIQSVWNTFLKKEQEYQELEASMDRVEQVNERIAALDRELSLEDAQAVADARAAYEALEEKERALVERLEVLISAEEIITVLQDNQAKADAVSEKIHAIGEVTLASADAIAQARADYQALTAAQKELVGERTRRILEQAEEKFTRLLEQQSHIQAFLSCMERIPQTLSLEDDSLNLVMKAHAAYLILTEEERTQIPEGSIQSIYAAENTLYSLAQEVMSDSDYEAARAMEGKIVAAGGGTGQVTLESEAALQSVRAEFDAMTNVQKALVGNYYYLVSLEMDLQALKENLKIAGQLDARIAALGEITLESEEEIRRLRSDYGSLTAAQKELVENYQLLAEAENRLADLKYNWNQAQAVAEKIHAIGEVTLDSKPAILRARAAYDALLDKQKVYIDEETKKLLEDAEAAYLRLEKLVLKSIQLDKDTLSLQKGMQERLTVFYNPENTISDRTVVWSTADAEVVTVENGIVTAKGGGETVVTAHVGKLTASCRVSVKVPVTGIVPTSPQLKLKKGTSALLSVRILPEDATKQAELCYVSSDPSVAFVDERGKIEAKAVGSAVITVSCQDQPEIFGKVTVFVTADGGSTKPPQQNITVSVKKAALKYAKNTGRRTALLKWKKVKGASGYEIYRSVNKKKKWKRAAIIKKGSTTGWTQKKLKKGRTYFYKIKAYRVVNGKKYYGKFSKVKAVKIKK